MSVKAKKHLGQHFLTDKNICEKIVIGYHNLYDSSYIAFTLASFT